MTGKVNLKIKLNALPYVLLSAPMVYLKWQGLTSISWWAAFSPLIFFGVLASCVLVAMLVVYLVVRFWYKESVTWTWW